MKTVDADRLISDLIEVRNLFNTTIPYENGIRTGITTAINRLKSAPVVESAQGKWEFSSVYKDSVGSNFAKVKCSCCGYEVFAIAHSVVDGNYCPKCGANMRR